MFNINTMFLKYFPFGDLTKTLYIYFSFIICKIKDLEELTVKFLLVFISPFYNQCRIVFSIKGT